MVAGGEVVEEPLGKLIIHAHKERTQLKYMWFKEMPRGCQDSMHIYFDGCFDLAHYGHFTSMQKARALGARLTVGVVSDEDVAKYKAPAVMTLEERKELVDSIRGVDAVIDGVSHILDEATTEELRNTLGVNLVVHGDDECIMPDGSDAYAYPKSVGMYWAIPRTPGISTTDLVRALLHDTPLPPCPLPFSLPQWTCQVDTVFVDGAFDCLHVGHVAFLQEAKGHGAHVVVGVHSDDTVSARRGKPPVMCMTDRARALLHCKYVDGVLLDTPSVLTPQFLQVMGATTVARGAVHETNNPDRHRYQHVAPNLVYVLSPSAITLGAIHRRILDNRETYMQKI